MMRLSDFPARAGDHAGLARRLSVEARCCQQAFSRRRTAVFGLFRMVRCPRCNRRAFVTDAITDRDWSRVCGDMARKRHGRKGVDA